MNKFVVSCVASLASAWLACFQIACALEQPNPADAILAGVRSRLPDRPFALRGDLLQANFHQFPTVVASFDAELDFAHVPAVAHYILRDRFGTAARQLTVIRPCGELPEFIFQNASGDSLQDHIDSPVPGTDLLWSDLTLDFLWWRGGVMLGHERILGRDCYVLEYSSAAENAHGGGSVAARLWVDVKLLALLQVEERDSKGARLRKVQVKDFKKIGGLWMIKNMEARNYTTETRTIINIRETRSLFDEKEVGDERPLPDE